MTRRLPSEKWRIEWPVAVAVLVCLAVVALLVGVYNSLAGGAIEVSSAEAEAEMEAVLGFDMASPVRVFDARDLGWAPTDGPHYGYTVELDSAGFASFFKQWPAEQDSLFWSCFDSTDAIRHEFEVDPKRRQVRYFHADL